MLTGYIPINITGRSLSVQNYLIQLNQKDTEETVFYAEFYTDHDL